MAPGSQTVRRRELPHSTGLSPLLAGVMTEFVSSPTRLQGDVGLIQSLHLTVEETEAHRGGGACPGTSPWVTVGFCVSGTPRALCTLAFLCAPRAQGLGDLGVPL